MVVVTVILAVAFTVICVVDYNQSVSEVYAELESALIRDINPRNDTIGSVRDEDITFDMRDAEPKGEPFELGVSDRHEPFVPIAVYEVMESNTLEAVSSFGNAALSDALLSSTAEAIISVPDGTGELNQFGLFYAKRDVKGRTLVAFADASSASSWQGLALVLAAVGIATLVVFFVASLLFSRWALLPVRQAWEKQKRFISDASHELKTPLTVMAANTAIIQRNGESTVASQSQWIESTETEIATMRELVDDMLFMASTDEGVSQTEPKESIDLSRLVEAQLLQFESLAFEKGIEMSSEIQGSIVVEGVRARLDRLIRTLLDNAFKYAPEGGEVEVCLSSTKKPVFTVRNTGMPISPEELEHVFDRFYRADEARSRETGGYGLGLSIAYDIAQAHNATLSAESNSNIGTVFTVAWH